MADGDRRGRQVALRIGLREEDGNRDEGHERIRRGVVGVGEPGGGEADGKDGDERLGEEQRL